MKTSQSRRVTRPHPKPGRLKHGSPGLSDTGQNVYQESPRAQPWVGTVEVQISIGKIVFPTKKDDQVRGNRWMEDQNRADGSS